MGMAIGTETGEKRTVGIFVVGSLDSFRISFRFSLCNTHAHTRAFSFRHANLTKKCPLPPTSCPESNNNDMILLSAEQIIIEMMSVLLTNNLNLLRFFPVLDKVSKWLRTLGQTKRALFVCMNTPVECICIIPFHWNVPCGKTDNIFRSCFYHVKLTFTSWTCSMWPNYNQLCEWYSNSCERPRIRENKYENGCKFLSTNPKR